MVGTDGNTYITGCQPIPTYQITNIKKQSPVTGIAGVVTITPTAANSTEYSMVVTYTSTKDGSIQTFPLFYTTAASGDTATTICNAFRTQLGDAANINFVASGTTTLILTATTTLPFIGVGGSLTAVYTNATSGATTIAPNISATVGTAGVVPYGTVALLQDKYPANTNNNGTNFAPITNLVSGATYIEYVISYNESPQTGGGSSTPAVDTPQCVVLVRSGVTNVATLTESWGTLDQLAAGYKATIVALGANVDYGSSNATRASGSFVTENLTAGDLIAISDGLTTTANGLATVLAAYTTGAAAGVTKAVINNTNTVSAGAGFVVHRANLPL